MHSGQPSQHRSFRVLSLDGGGIRGVFPLSFLSEIEGNLSHPIGEYFDLIAGTSIGGVAALGLAMGRTASDLCDIFTTRSDQIFRRRPPTVREKILQFGAWFLSTKWPKASEAIRRIGLAQSKYKQRGIQDVLTDEFGSSTIEDIDRARVVVPAVDLTQADTTVFKTPHLPDLTRDRRFSVADVALAATAAPTYFPHASIEEGSAYSDGGLWANNPSMIAYAESVYISRSCGRPEDPLFDNSDIMMLSVGTGRPTHFGRPEKEDTGFVWWAPRLLNIIGLSQSLGYSNLARYVLGDRYYRINYEIPDESWQLDNVDVIQQLSHIGRERARRHFGSLRAPFFSERTAPYTPFPLD